MKGQQITEDEEIKTIICSLSNQQINFRSKSKRKLFIKKKNKN